jgi:hypothetical protein
MSKCKVRIPSIFYYCSFTYLQLYLFPLAPPVVLRGSHFPVHVLMAVCDVLLGLLVLDLGGHVLEALMGGKKNCLALVCAARKFFEVSNCYGLCTACRYLHLPVFFF